jgi:hypothetical protein
VEARVRVFKKAEKAWGDLDFGDFAIAVGGGADKRGARVGFKAPLATRPALAAELNDAVKVVEVAAKDGKHGGLQRPGRPPLRLFSVCQGMPMGCTVSDG